jgi:pimeloyl-ACP methyl ester carboxylesterase
MFVQPHFVDTNGIRMAVYEQGEGKPVILLHGFPELAFSWRHQLPALASAGYRAIAPDQRGYGKTTCPVDVEAYRIEELIADVHGLLDALRLDSAVFVGHDWGALLLWHMAVVAPERIDKLISLNIPHIARPAIDPIELMRRRFGDDYYIVNFQDSDAAERAFASDTHHFFDAVMRKNQIDREHFDKLPVERKSINLLESLRRDNPSGEALLSGAERDYYAQAFAASGFTGPINWYRNWTHNWQALEGINQTITIPTLFIGAVNDVVVTPEQIEAMRPLIADLEIHMLDDCGHWSQQERPADVNRVMLDWLMQRR